MILDTSALLAVILREREAPTFSQIMDRVEVVRLSAAGYLEAAIVMQRSRDPVLANVLDDFLTEFSIQIEPVTADQARLARQAFQLFGKGVHRAGLNFGDCFTYALAKTMREPVLFKGNGFSKTDLIPAWTPDRSS